MARGWPSGDDAAPATYRSLSATRWSSLSTGIMFALVTWAWHGTLVSAAYCCLTASMIAVGLIEYGGQRAPLSVAAIGTGVAQVDHRDRRRLASPLGQSSADR